MKHKIMKRFISALICAMLCTTTCFAVDWENPESAEAEALMARCEEVLWKEKCRRCPDFDHSYDPYHTGLVGIEFSPLTTTLGKWGEKTSATFPAQAGAVVDYMLKAGLQKGDWIAINSSSSYPGFTLATLCAVEVLQLNTVFVLSYGTSMYGCTLADFTFPVMLDTLRNAGLLDVKIDALVPGGWNDAMEQPLLEDGRPVVARLMKKRSELCLTEGLKKNMKTRHRLFDRHPVKMFVNSGGTAASLGSGNRATVIGHGLVRNCPDIPDAEDRGLLFDYLDRGIPVLNLLCTKKICEDYGIPYLDNDDPASNS